MQIGVLALQGDFESHAKSMEALGSKCSFVKKKEDLNEISGLIIPGGESSTFLKLLTDDLKAALVERISSGLPTFATCAGVILLAKNVTNPEQTSLGLLDLDVSRNGYGRQIDSFIEPELKVTREGRETFQSFNLTGATDGVFIRAPRITRIGTNVKTLMTKDSEAVLVMQDSIIGATFHPELSDTSHLASKLFLSLLQH